MKLIIQIPCYNEAETLVVALNDLPKHIDGIDEIEYLIINDGSSDDTEQIALAWGVDYVVHFKRNLGLAKGFLAGIDIENDCDAIDKAVNGVSEDKTNELLRGYGLNSSLNLVVRGNGGEILISSRKGLLHLDKYEKKFKELKKNYIQGTQVSMLINKSNLEDFYPYMEHIKI